MHRAIEMGQGTNKVAGNKTERDRSSRCWMLGADMKRSWLQKTDLVVDEILVKVVVPKLRVMVWLCGTHEAGTNLGNAGLAETGFLPESNDVAPGGLVQICPPAIHRAHAEVSHRLAQQEGERRRQHG